MGRRVFAFALFVSLLGHLAVLSVSLATHSRGRVVPEEGVVRVVLREDVPATEEPTVTTAPTTAKETLARAAKSADAPSLAEAVVNLDRTESPYLDYLMKVKRRIERYWSAPAGFDVGDGRGVATVRFSLDAHGNLVDYYIRASSGYPGLDHQALGAVKTASPYDPFPPSMRLSRLHIDADFHYK